MSLPRPLIELFSRHRGLAVVGWNVDAGDLRVAHLIGLHGVQVIPFVAFLLMRSRLDDRRRLIVLGIFSAGYTLLGVLLFWQAIAGIPLLDLGP